MLTKSPSTSSSDPNRTASRDVELADFARSILEAAQREWPDRLVTEPDGQGPPVHLYTETHFALAAVLLSLLTGRERGLLDLAASRLRLWDEAGGPALAMFAFNAMAVCLTSIVLRRSGEQHAELQGVLGELIDRTREFRDDVRAMNCGNNAYLQQVAVDMVLLPIARKKAPSADQVDAVVREFDRYRTPEGFFYDLPRSGTSQERLSPPTYIMKMLFLAGLCHELHPTRSFERLFRPGMAGALPLLTREGHFSYFGRTDNSPFAAGLTLFNLRKAAAFTDHDASSFDEAGAAAERYYVTFPRTSHGLLQSNRFGRADSPAEFRWSRDAYAYVGQYSLASCAYALLGAYWFPRPYDAPSVRQPARDSVAVSNDLGVVKLAAGQSTLFLRTRSELTAWDRRYLGPTVLRFEHRGRLLVGAISKTLSTDAIVRPKRGSRAFKAWTWVRDKFVDGIEQLDGTSVGFLPVLRRGTVDYLPSRVVTQDVERTRVRIRYEMVRLHSRGLRPWAIEARELMHRRLPLFRPVEYSRPPISTVPSLYLDRDVFLTATGCRIEDRISGNLRGKRLLFSVRHLPEASVRVSGLNAAGSSSGWGSDGRQALHLYQTDAEGSEIRYACDIDSAQHN